jgi:predicted nucleic acid-binding protein
MKYVIDASTAFQWEVPEPNSLKAIQLRERYRRGIHELISPDIFPAEVGNALIVAERKGRIVSGQFAIRLAAILAFFPDLRSTRPLAIRACSIIASVTTGFRLSFYDAVYVALGEREGCA